MQTEWYKAIMAQQKDAALRGLDFHVYLKLKRENKLPPKK